MHPAENPNPFRAVVALIFPPEVLDPNAIYEPLFNKTVFTARGNSGIFRE
jgi:hypothetical protein